MHFELVLNHDRAKSSACGCAEILRRKHAVPAILSSCHWPGLAPACRFNRYRKARVRKGYKKDHGAGCICVRDGAAVETLMQIYFGTGPDMCKAAIAAKVYYTAYNREVRVGPQMRHRVVLMG